ncbi:uncharacterized protein LOC135211039 [Macrobrachium nipponense]|uniref:uncharacterized protein LOC135211039 n=1 Tax=Macrobrachium nipponense TaxID=159736 RepID=UPI0030C87D76
MSAVFASTTFQRITGKLWKVGSASVSSNICLSRCKSTGNIKWLWRASDGIKEVHRANDKGYGVGGYGVTFNSTKPLSQDLFREAVEHLHRKIPWLGVCLQPYKGELWYCQPLNLELNFKVLEDGDVANVLSQATKDGFKDPGNTQGTFTVICRKPSAPCLIPEVKKHFPHQYDFVISEHMGVCDGMSLSYIIKWMAVILDDLAAGRTVSDEEVVPITNNDEVSVLLTQIKDSLVHDKHLTEAILRTRPKPDQVPLFFQVFPRPTKAGQCTKNIRRVMESKFLDPLLQRCKMEKVTVNSALMAALNIAIVNLVEEKGFAKDVCEVSCNLYTDYRRYMRPTETFHLGPFRSSMSYISAVDDSCRKNFWDYSRRVDGGVRSALNNKLTMKQYVAREMVENADKICYDYVTTVRPALHDYSLTNLGDFTPLLHNNGDHVQITAVDAIACIHNSLNSSLHAVVTFRGRMTYNVFYATDYFTETTVNALLDELFSVLQKSIFSKG